MKTIRCRNCGITYQETATLCLRCMSPLEKSIIKINNKPDHQFTNGAIHDVSSIRKTSIGEPKTKSVEKLRQIEKGQLIQKAVRPKNIGHRTITPIESLHSELVKPPVEPVLANSIGGSFEKNLQKSNEFIQKPVVDQRIDNISKTIPSTSEPPTNETNLERLDDGSIETKLHEDLRQNIQQIDNRHPIEERVIERSKNSFPESDSLSANQLAENDDEESLEIEPEQTIPSIDGTKTNLMKSEPNSTSQVGDNSIQEILPNEGLETIDSTAQNIRYPVQQKQAELTIEEEFIDDSKSLLAEMEDLLGESSNKGNNLQSFMNHLKNDYGIKLISKADFFSENGYFLTNGIISHLNLSKFEKKEILSKFLKNELSSLQNLKMLDLRDNHLTPVDIDPIYKLKGLKSLNLGKNEINNLSEKIANLENLEGLFLSELPIDTLPDLSALKKLKEINLSGSTIKLLPKSLLSLANLRTLNVFSTPITPDNEILIQLRTSTVYIII